MTAKVDWVATFLIVAHFPPFGLHSIPEKPPIFISKNIDEFM